MHLNSLTLLGFKSFAEKTALIFQPGITCIVGPNGCGKSNVADAIRWVLGEQSAKALRGGEMADVIFNGTDARKPLSMAEVSLTVKDVDQDQLRAAGVELTYNEVTVSRRIFRDGSSEYFINRTPCRLKDIQQLFLGTGVGRASYSIMAQGNITQILSSKPEDRRLVFEEAAGITRFKSQKREALRKLEVTEQNLVRISDLIREIKRQIGSLQRQAGKARRYRACQQELQHLDTQLARHRFDVLQLEIAERQETLQQLRDRLEHTHARVSQEENELLQLRTQSSELEHELNLTQQRGLELRNQAERHEHRIQFNEERLRELETRHASALQDIAGSEERLTTTAREIEILSERIHLAAQSVTDLRRVQQERQQAVREIDSLLDQRRQDLQRAQAALFQAAQQLSRLRNEINALDLLKQGNLSRLEKLSAEKIQLEEERTGSEQRLLEFSASVEAERTHVQSRRLSVDEQQVRLRDLQSQLESAGADLDRLLQQQAGLRSRLGVLEQLQAEHEGFNPGTLAALQQTREALGSLADRIRVPDPYVIAIEQALGHHLQLVLTQQPESARQILDELSAHKQGRASVVPLAWHEPAAGGSSPPLPDCPHGQPALGVIEADSGVRPLLQRLLARTRIVDNLADATAAWANGGNDFNYVTYRGELLSRDGIFTGGDLNGAQSLPSSILGRKNQIADLQAQLGALQTQIADASRQRGQWLSEQTAAQAALQSDQNDLRAREVAVATHQGEVTALQHSVKLLHQKIETVVFEIQSLARQQEEAEQKRADLAARAVAFEQDERTRQLELDTLNAELESQRQQRETANAALTEIRIALATEEQLAQSLQRQQTPLQLRQQELEQGIAQRRNDIAEALERRARAESEIAESHQRIDALHHERDQVSQQAAALEDRRGSLETSITEREDALREHRERLGQIQEQRGTLEIELAQKQMGTDNLRTRIREKYQLELDDIRSECITITFADQGAPRIRTLTPDEMAAAGAATDWNAVADQVAGLEARLAEMGPVNLVAIEEYEETEQRYQFLTKQHDDLVSAKNELHQILNRINTQTRTLFVETFTRIRDNFRLMFSEVFAGGKADLRLVDEGDVLESGIEIVARPPGKQLQTISLLSGGEQTMTAVALLFAIYQVKPSPFCVLDELDAPLDESNINRFIHILQRFVPHSQFIIITHNKRTIGMADVLYGVTMPEEGISRLVSVKFHKAETATNSPPALPLVPTGFDVPDVEQEEDALQTTEDTLEVAHASS
jgi:chromosome segregation protein